MGPPVATPPRHDLDPMMDHRGATPPGHATGVTLDRLLAVTPVHPRGREITMPALRESINHSSNGSRSHRSRSNSSPPPDETTRDQPALDMALGEAPSDAAAAVATPAIATPSTAAAPAADAKVIGRSDNPTQHILVHNMYDKDEEMEQGWENNIKLDFEDECAQYGKITAVVVMAKEPGGKIYASFNSADGAMSCATNLVGRWFDKRQIQVEFVESVPNSA